MGRINILDAQTSNLIAAGEVVERPSSAVKEMLENSIDAGAKNIILEIKDGGRTLVRVTDDGSGIMRDDVPKALLRHATSKIECGDDISGIKTLGFRGEALAAISSVSRLDIITKSREETLGTHLTADENGIVMTDTGCPDGTTVIMRDLFYNTPARQKFLKRDGTEGGSCVAAAEKVALSHPEISFTVISDGQRKFMTNGDGNLKQAVYAVLGREFTNKLLEVSYDFEGVRTYGFVTSPDASRGSRAMQIAFVNNRYVKSKTVQAALEEAFRSHIAGGKFPGCVLFVSLDENLTDVNVHPAKTEIKFASEKNVFHSVYYAVKNALALPTETPLGKVKKELPADDTDTLIFSSPEPKTAFSEDEIKIKISPLPEKQKTFRADIGEEDILDTSVFLSVRDSGKAPEIPSVPSDHEPIQTLIAEEKPVWRMIGQAYDAYIFVETEENVLIIDKHAAHERLIYEKLAKNKELHVQQLLSGIPVNVGREQASVLLENSDNLAEKGFEIEDFGDGIILVRSVPSTLENVKGLQNILEDFAKDLSLGNGLSFKEKCDRALYTVACKAALKAGIKNTPEDDENVVKMLSENPELRFCPHGRPFIKKLPKRDIEKYFDR